jgi:hypothetical protein
MSGWLLVEVDAEDSALELRLVDVEGDMNKFVKISLYYLFIFN